MKKTILSLLIILIFISGCSENNLPQTCYEKVKGIGDGFDMFNGYEFNKEKGKCVQKSVSGFEYYTPFNSLNECKSICEWNLEINKLIKKGCTQIQVDVDGNTCSLNEEKTEYQYCTEMLTTQKLELPKCINYE